MARILVRSALEADDGEGDAVHCCVYSDFEDLRWCLKTRLPEGLGIRDGKTSLEDCNELGKVRRLAMRLKPRDSPMRFGEGYDPDAIIDDMLMMEASKSM